MLRQSFISLTLAFGLCTSASASPDQEKNTNALTYATAVQAAIYGLPIEGMMLRLSAEVLDPATRKAPFNAYFHYTALATPDVSPFRGPNNDTLYSTAWLDLRDGPVVLDMPNTAGRYYTAHIMDLTTETIANIGQRLNGTEAGSFAIVGPNWEGEPPSGVKQVIKSETAFATVLLRLLVDGPDDVAAVNTLQKQFVIRPLAAAARLNTKSAALEPFRAASPVERFRLLDRALRMDPIRRGEEALMSVFAGISLGPSTVQQMATPSPEVLDRAYADAQSVAEAAGLRMGEYADGWRLMRDGMGTYGFDYLQRAAVWVGGPLANVIEESLYPSAITDSTGERLDGSHSYSIRFDKSRLPPVRAFWSLTMYDMATGNLVSNPINRYSIGNRTRGLNFAQDGSLTIYVQNSEPTDAVKRTNWLPAPKAPFYMVLRLYGPEQTAISSKWLPPPVVRD